MMNTSAPKDGDFASYLEEKGKQQDGIRYPEESDVASNDFGEPSPVADRATHQTINDVLVDGREPTEEFLEEMNALENAPPLSDEELERQALSDPGADGDVRTPE
jgi:hypothetical protein